MKLHSNFHSQKAKGAKKKTNVCPTHSIYQSEVVYL